MRDILWRGKVKNRKKKVLDSVPKKCVNQKTGKELKEI